MGAIYAHVSAGFPDRNSARPGCRVSSKTFRPSVSCGASSGGIASSFSKPSSLTVFTSAREESV